MGGVALAVLQFGDAGAAHARRPDEQELLRQLRKRGLEVDSIVLPHALNREMEVWLATAVPPEVGKQQRVERLLESLLSRSQLDLEYHQGYTGTAIEAFDSRRANCLAFTHLFVGMARQLDLPVYYLKVDDLQSFEREGDLVVVSGHITAGTGPVRNPRVLEFAIFPVAEYRNLRPLSDLSAVALFYSNRGAELLLKGDREGALSWLETAVRIDDSLADAWLNLGVVHRRLGALEEAESAYWRALEIDPESTSAYQNLSALLLNNVERREEGLRLLALTDRGGNQNPFNFLTLGDISLDRGSLEDAERYYRRALQLAPEAAEAQAAMGEWALASGRRGRARKWLKRARRSDPQDPRVLRLAQQIAEG